MNKKGFTLIEILAAMAVLSLIILMIIPNVISTLNDAKKSTFINDCRSIYKSANSSYVLDSVKTTDSFAYGNGFRVIGQTQLKELDVSGNDNMCYIVQFDDDGNISYFFASDGNYQLEQGTLNKKVKKVGLNDINDDSVKEAKNNIRCGKELTLINPEEGGSIDIGDTTMPSLDLTYVDHVFNELYNCSIGRGYLMKQSSDDIIINYVVQTPNKSENFTVNAIEDEDNLTVNINSMHMGTGAINADLYCHILIIKLYNKNINSYNITVNNNGQKTSKIKCEDCMIFTDI